MGRRGGRGISTVRAGAGAAVGVVAEGVDVHSALGVGVVAADVPGDGGVGGLGGLLEGYGALDVGVTAEDCDCWHIIWVSRCSSSPPLMMMMEIAIVMLMMDDR